MRFHNTPKTRRSDSLVRGINNRKLKSLHKQLAKVIDQPIHRQSDHIATDHHGRTIIRTNGGLMILTQKGKLLQKIQTIENTK